MNLNVWEQRAFWRKFPTVSRHAAPIVAMPKKDGMFCICGEYKVTINEDVAVDQYRLPNSEELFTALARFSVFPNWISHRLTSSYILLS